MPDETVPDYPNLKCQKCGNEDIFREFAFWEGGQEFHRPKDNQVSIDWGSIEILDAPVRSIEEVRCLVCDEIVWSAPSGLRCDECDRSALTFCNCGTRSCFRHGSSHITNHQDHLMDVIKGKEKQFDALMNEVVELERGVAT